MTMDDKVKALALRLATTDKTLLTYINGNVLGLSSLTTTQKTNLVAAINETVARIAAIISDTGASATSTYSSTKIESVIATAVTAAKNEILGGAGPAYDTLKELRDAMVASDSEDDSAIAAINTALGNRVRVDAAQSFTEPQKAQARSNIDVWSKAEVGPIDTDYVAIYEAGL